MVQILTRGIVEKQEADVVIALLAHALDMRE